GEQRALGLGDSTVERRALPPAGAVKMAQRAVVLAVEWAHLTALVENKNFDALQPRPAQMRQAIGEQLRAIRGGDEHGNSRSAHAILPRRASDSRRGAT